MAQIVIEIDKSLAQELKAEFPGKDAVLIDSDRFDGVAVAQVFVTLSAAVIPAVTKVVLEAIRARKHVEIRKGGFVVKGVTEDTAMKILKQLSDED